MQLTVPDIARAVDLIARHRHAWAWPPWLFQLLARKDHGQAVVLESIEEPSSGTVIALVALWRQSHPQPEIVRLCFSRKQDLSSWEGDLFQVQPGTSDYLYTDGAGITHRYKPQPARGVVATDQKDQRRD